MSLVLTSPAFDHEGPIPIIHTSDGEDLSPELAWGGLPEGTRTLALIVDDPDAPDPEAPKTTWVHWVIYDMAPSTTGLPEDVAPEALTNGAKEGINDWKRLGWGGPCPPVGRHRYHFKLYALDCEIGDMAMPTKDAVESAMSVTSWPRRR